MVLTVYGGLADDIGGLVLQAYNQLIDGLVEGHVKGRREKRRSAEGWGSRHVRNNNLISTDTYWEMDIQQPSRPHPLGHNMSNSIPPPKPTLTVVDRQPSVRRLLNPFVVVLSSETLAVSDDASIPTYRPTYIAKERRR